jgi:imidazole glycerol-phosphate synthase subunit HisH
MRVSVIDYGIGNIQSVINALNRAGSCAVSARDSHELIDQDPERIVLPGVGAVGQALSNLRDRGLEAALNECVINNKTPFLGICVGMQILSEKCTEFGEHQGLGWIPGSVDKLSPVNGENKLPHIGWNTIDVVDNNSLFSTLNGHDFYFVHSYALNTSKEYISATTEYGQVFVSAVRREHIAGVQFHPEKSSKLGDILLKEFLKGFN